MVHSRKSKSNNLLCDTKQVLLAHIKQNSQITIALSGGIDSVVLLNLLVTLSKQIQFSLSAIHVNHGISHNAKQWSQFCCDLCHTYDIPISVIYLKIKKESGVSLEAIAREERYHAFNHAQADYVILAQHLDDQAETFLLQLFRGAGVKGLSAMPVVRRHPSATMPQILRPLLSVSRDRIEEYARQSNLTWVTDESNDSTAFDRNFLRHDILPVLKTRYPGYQKTLLRTSQHFAEASSLLSELAEIDLENCVINARLQIDAMRQLSSSRIKNLLRYVLSQQGVQPPSTSKLEDILHQLMSARIDAQIHIVFGNTEIRCYKGALYISPRRKLPDTIEPIRWQGEEKLVLKDLNGTLKFTYAENQGIDQNKIKEEPVMICLRSGGEHFTPDCNRPRRSLKNLFQETFIPPWERNALPLLFSGEKLVWVPGIGIDCAYQVKSPEQGLLPIWQPDG